MTNESTIGQPPYCEEKTTRWLSWLADAMKRNAETEFLFERLQPTWLEENNGSRFLYVMVSRLIQAFVIGLLFTAMVNAMDASNAAKIGKTNLHDTVYWFLHIAWAVVAGVTLGILDFYRLGNQRKWKWLNNPTFSESSAKKLLKIAATCLKPLSFIPAVAKLRHTMPTMSTWMKGQLDKAAQHLLAWLVVWVVVGTVMGLTVLPLMLSMEFNEKNEQISQMVLFVILVGLISSRAIARTWNNDIECVETLGQSWGRATVGAFLGAVGGGLVGWTFFPGGFAQQGIVVLIVGAVVGSAFHGLVVSVQEVSARPNRGVVLSLQHSLKYGSFIGVLCGTIWGFHIWNLAAPGTDKLTVPVCCGCVGLVAGLILRSVLKLKESVSTRSAAIGGAMFVGLIGTMTMMSKDLTVLVGTISGIICIGLVAAIWFGGLELIRHYTLRGILWLRGDTPLICIPFYNYCAEKLVFLERVGGGYMFIHRYLLEHFVGYHRPSRSTVPNEHPPKTDGLPTGES